MEHLQKRPAAAALIRGGDLAPRLSGIIQFFPVSRGVIVSADVIGLPAENPCGIFALHLHEGTGCGGKSFSETGGHYNPGGEAHPCHAGDLPTLFSCRGRAFSAVLTDRFSIQEIIGRTVVIHSGSDDFTTQPAGNSGSKIACGVIFPV